MVLAMSKISSNFKLVNEMHARNRPPPREVRDFRLPYASDATIVDVKPSKKMPKLNLHFTLFLR